MLKTLLNKLAKVGIKYYGFTEVSKDGKETKMDCHYINGQWIIRQANQKREGDMKTNIGNKVYITGKRKSTGNYAIWELKKAKYEIIYETASFEELKKKIKHLKSLADKREARQMIADICGTSYSAAMRDMGLSKY